MSCSAGAGACASASACAHGDVDDGSRCLVGPNTIDADSENTCVVIHDGTVACWGYDSPDEPAGTYLALGKGSAFTCGLRADHTTTCVGDDDKEQSSPPAGTFRSVSAGEQHSCGVRTDGTIACWGMDDDAEDSVDAFEQHRNDVVEAYQHNRNPCIDRPDFVARISDF